ncbi:hypothetical protein ACJW30_06G066600 [Castanea mollissima]
MQISLSNDRGINCHSLYIIPSPTKVVTHNLITTYIVRNILRKTICVILVTLGTNTGIKDIPSFSFDNNIPILLPFVFHIKNLCSLRCQDIRFIYHFIPTMYEVCKIHHRKPKFISLISSPILVINPFTLE